MTANTPKTRREKGKRFERAVAKLIKRKGLGGAQRTPMSGAMSQWRGDILTDLPIHFECKNQETVKFWSWVTQAREQCPLAHDWVLCITGAHRPEVAVVDLEYLMDLLVDRQELLNGNR